MFYDDFTTDAQSTFYTGAVPPGPFPPGAPFAVGPSPTVNRTLKLDMTASPTSSSGARVAVNTAAGVLEYANDPGVNSLLTITYSAGYDVPAFVQFDMTADLAGTVGFVTVTDSLAVSSTLPFGPQPAGLSTVFVAGFVGLIDAATIAVVIDPIADTDLQIGYVIPEPHMTALFAGLGLLGLVAWRRFRK